MINNIKIWNDNYWKQLHIRSATKCLPLNIINILPRHGKSPYSIRNTRPCCVVHTCSYKISMSWLSGICKVQCLKASSDQRFVCQRNGFRKLQRKALAVWVTQLQLGRSSCKKSNVFSFKQRPLKRYDHSAASSCWYSRVSTWHGCCIHTVGIHKQQWQTFGWRREERSSEIFLKHQPVCMTSVLQTEYSALWGLLCTLCRDTPVVVENNSDLLNVTSLTLTPQSELYSCETLQGHTVAWGCTEVQLQLVEGEGDLWSEGHLKTSSVCTNRGVCAFLLLLLFPFLSGLTWVSAAPSPAGFSGQESCEQTLSSATRPAMTGDRLILLDSTDLVLLFKPKYNLRI